MIDKVSSIETCSSVYRSTSAKNFGRTYNDQVNMSRSKLPISSKLVNRLMTSFTTQVARRGFRFLGVPKTFIPFLANSIRQINRKIQWGNRALWNERFHHLKFLFEEFKKGQHDISPVYRFRGGSDTLRREQGIPSVNDVKASQTQRMHAELKNHPKTRLDQLRSKLDPSSLFMGGLAFVVIASIGGPALAKKVNWVDPLDAASQRLESSGIQNR